MAARKTYDLRFLFRRYILIVVDILLILMALFVYLRFFHSSALSDYHNFIDNLTWIILIVLLWFFYSYLFNLYKLKNVDRIFLTIRNTVFTALLTGITYLFIPFLSPTLPENRFPAFVLIAAMVILVLIWRMCYAAFFRHPILNKTAIVVGAGYTGREIVRTLLHIPSIYHRTAYRIFGYIDDDPAKQGKVYDQVKVLGNSNLLVTYANRLHVNELILAIPETENVSGLLYTEILRCEQSGMNVLQATELYEDLTGKVMVKDKGGMFYLTNPYSIVHSDNFYQLINRIMNILCGVLAAILIIVILPVVWIGNLMFSRGPLFYTQERVGKNGRLFHIIKFRTMIVDAEKLTGPQFASKGDERITRVGKFLRRTRLDEFPQFINILKGEMNLIGPRPERQYFVEELSKKIPFFPLRNSVKPGLTGWAQVKHTYAAGVDDSLIKLQYDLYYIKHRSLLLDLQIILKTIAVILKFKGT
jgi:exopolysaccharide biosynthesis polyprenyl glycosylphosphotransferase